MAGHAEGAEQPLRQAIARRRASGDEHNALLDENALGLLLIALERHEEAVAVLSAAARRAQHLRDGLAQPFVWHALAVALLAHGRPSQAYEAALEATRVSTTTLHGDTNLLLGVTLARITIASLRENVDPADVMPQLQVALCDDGAAWYAALALAEYRQDCLGDHTSAARLWELLQHAPLEAHVAALVRARTCGPSQVRGTGAPQHTDLETLRRLVARVDDGIGTLSV